MVFFCILIGYKLQHFRKTDASRKFRTNHSVLHKPVWAFRNQMDKRKIKILKAVLAEVSACFDGVLK